MNRTLIVDPQADYDVDETFVFMAEHHSEARAYRFLDAARRTFRRLAEMPRVGMAVPLQALPDVRRWFVEGFPRYLVFYRVTDEEVIIHRVLHGSRDIRAVLEGEPPGSDADDEQE